MPATPANDLGNGCLYAQQNGFTAGGSQNVTMTSNITSPPPTAPGMTVTYWVTVRVTQSVPQFFSAVLGNTTATVVARATAAVLGSATGPCVYALDPSAANAISATSGASLSVSCAVDADSSNAQAISVTSGASITAAAVNVVGNYVVNSGGSINPLPTTGVASVNDPEAAVNAPSYAAVCDFPNYSVVAGHSATVIPGVYCNGININSGATASFNSGVYILRGGGLQITSGATVTGTGVGFYNTANGYTYQPININSGASVSLSAASSGSMANMFNGVLYFPNSPVSYSSGSSSNWGYTTLVAKTLSFTSGSYFHTFTAVAGGLGSRQAVLVG